jgi:hypothetical protein
VRRAVLLTVALTASLLSTGCADQAICRNGEYPVTAVGSTGRACVPGDQEPPAGYVRFPAGQEPKRTGDKWDEYWTTHMIDKSGAAVAVDR